MAWRLGRISSIQCLAGDAITSPRDDHAGTQDVQTHRCSVRMSITSKGLVRIESHRTTPPSQRPCFGLGPSQADPAPPPLMQRKRAARALTVPGPSFPPPWHPIVLAFVGSGWRLATQSDEMKLGCAGDRPDEQHSRSRGLPLHEQSMPSMA